MTFEIEDNVTRPAKAHRSGGRASVYPFVTLRINSAFKVPFTSEDQKERDKLIRRVRTAVLAFKAAHKGEGYAFQTWSALKTNPNFAEDEKDGREGLRVKRVEFIAKDEVTTSA